MVLVDCWQIFDYFTKTIYNLKDNKNVVCHVFLGQEGLKSDGHESKYVGGKQATGGG